MAEEISVSDRNSEILLQARNRRKLILSWSLSYLDTVLHTIRK